MKIFLFTALCLLAIASIGKKIFNSAKRNLYKDHTAWSAKELKIKRNPSLTVNNNDNNNYLKIIADESKIYLEEQSEKEID